MKKILLLGSGGYLGKILKNVLKTDFKILAPVKKKGFDIEKKKILKRYLDKKIDIIINLTGQYKSDTKKMINVIENGNSNIINLTKEMNQNILLVYISTALVYGYSNKKKNETHDPKPINIYEKKKFALEKKYVNSPKNYLILRLTNLYGNTDKKGVIGKIKNCFKLNKYFCCDNLNTYKNFIHVKDVANIVKILLKKNVTNMTLNIGNENIKFKSILTTLTKLTKNKFKYTNKNKDIKKTISQKINVTKIKKIIGKYKFITIKKYLKNEFIN